MVFAHPLSSGFPWQSGHLLNDSYLPMRRQPANIVKRMHLSQEGNWFDLIDWAQEAIDFNAFLTIFPPKDRLQPLVGMLAFSLLMFEDPKQPHKKIIMKPYSISSNSFRFILITIAIFSHSTCTLQAVEDASSSVFTQEQLDLLMKQEICYQKRTPSHWENDAELAEICNQLFGEESGGVDLFCDFVSSFDQGPNIDFPSFPGSMWNNWKMSNGHRSHGQDGRSRMLCRLREDIG